MVLFWLFVTLLLCGQILLMAQRRAGDLRD
jgi:hypothetical protein